MNSSRAKNTTSATPAQRIGAAKRYGLKENPRPSGEIPVPHSHRPATSPGGSEFIHAARGMSHHPTQRPATIERGIPSQTQIRPLTDDSPSALPAPPHLSSNPM